MSRLKEEIELEIGRIQELSARVERLLALTSDTEDPDYRAGLVSGLALHLHGFYTGAERILYAIARATDGSLPSGSNWHKQLLDQMRLEIPGIRPAVLSERTYQELDEFRGFRHVVRSLYAYNLDAGRVLALTERLATCSENFTREIRAFCEFLTG